MDAQRADPMPSHPAVPDRPTSAPVDSAQQFPRPVHLRWQYLVLVGAGGAVGTAAREGVTLLVPPLGQFPVATFAINLSGALLLGVLLEVLSRGGPDHGRRRAVRLLIGTGFLGGFTTYSALAVDTAALLGGDGTLAGVLYAAGTLLLGGAATWFGILIGSALHRRDGRAQSGSVA